LRQWLGFKFLVNRIAVSALKFFFAFPFKAAVTNCSAHIYCTFWVFFVQLHRDSIYYLSQGFQSLVVGPFFSLLPLLLFSFLVFLLFPLLLSHFFYFFLSLSLFSFLSSLSRLLIQLSFFHVTFLSPLTRFPFRLSFSFFSILFFSGFLPPYTKIPNFFFLFSLIFLPLDAFLYCTRTVFHSPLF